MALRTRTVRVDFDGRQRQQPLPLRLTKRSLRGHLSALRGVPDRRIRLYQKNGALFVDVLGSDGWEPTYTIR